MRSFDAQRRRVAKLMAESCVITRPASRYAKGSMNQSTGEVTPPTPEVIYTGSIYIAAQATIQARTQAVGGLDAAQKTYYGGIPHDAASLRPGDEVEITASEDNPRLVGKKYKVDSVEDGSIAIWQLCKMTDLETSRG